MHSRSRPVVNFDQEVGAHEHSGKRIARGR
jgi:hypothetical protein